MESGALSPKTITNSGRRVKSPRRWATDLPPKPMKQQDSLMDSFVNNSDNNSIDSDVTLPQCAEDNKALGDIAINRPQTRLRYSQSLSSSCGTPTSGSNGAIIGSPLGAKRSVNYNVHHMWNAAFYEASSRRLKYFSRRLARCQSTVNGGSPQHDMDSVKQWVSDSCNQHTDGEASGEVNKEKCMEIGNKAAIKEVAKESVDICQPNRPHRVSRHSIIQRYDVAQQRIIDNFIRRKRLLISPPSKEETPTPVIVDQKETTIFKRPVAPAPRVKKNGDNLVNSSIAVSGLPVPLCQNVRKSLPFPQISLPLTSPMKVNLPISSPRYFDVNPFAYTFELYPPQSSVELKSTRLVKHLSPERQLVCKRVRVECKRGQKEKVLREDFLIRCSS